MIRLRLEGELAHGGIAWNALEGFLEKFADALVALHREARGVELVRAGPPDKLDLAATALKIVRLDPGSAVLEVEPLDAGPEGGLAHDAASLPESTIERLLSAVDEGRPLPDPVTTPLDEARLKCGTDGRFTIGTRQNGQIRETIFDRQVIESLRPPLPERVDDDEREIAVVVGRLIQLSETPDRVLIREPDGTEWLCRFDDEVAERLGPLWRHTVVAEGAGEVPDAGKPRFHIRSVRRAIVESEQTELFTIEQIPTDDLIAAAGVVSPQGLDILSPEYEKDEESEERYLAAILGD